MVPTTMTATPPTVMVAAAMAPAVVMAVVHLHDAIIRRRVIQDGDRHGGGRANGDRANRGEHHTAKRITAHCRLPSRGDSQNSRPSSEDGSSSPTVDRGSSGARRSHIV